MATLETFDARSLGLDFSPLLQIRQALDINKNRQSAERKLALDEEIRRGTLGVAEADLILREEASGLAREKFESTQTRQQGIQETLAQLINPPQAQADQIIPGQIIEQNVGEFPAPVIQPSPQVDFRKREELFLKLAGIKGGPAIVKAIEPIFAGRDKRAKEALAKQVDEVQAFALSLSRMDSREKQDRAIANEIAKQSRTGDVDPSLIELRNMNDADREQELFLDIAQGDVLQELAKNELIPPVIKPVSETSAVKNAKAIGLVPGTPEFNKFVREKTGGAQVTISAFEKESEKLRARSDATVRDEIRGNARTASRQLGRVRSLGKLLEKTGTGALTQFLPDLARLIPGLDASNEQAASAQINSFILDEMAKFKGSTSDRELNFASQTVQQLGNTPEANRMILRNFENVIFLSQQENRQFDEFTKGEGKPRDFIFNFQEVIFPNHPTFGNVTLDDIQTTALANEITMEKTIQEMRKR